MQVQSNTALLTDASQLASLRMRRGKTRTLALIETVPIGDIKVRATVNAPSERDRLKLLDIVGTEDGGWYFHSLLWERRSFGDEWRKHHELTQDDFQWQHPNRRWVADVHSFSPDDGSASGAGRGRKQANVSPVSG